MNKSIVLCVAALMTAAGFADAPKHELTVMSYNIHNGWGKSGEKWNIGLPIHVIRKVSPDVCAMQELSWGGEAKGFQIDTPTIMGHILAPLWRMALAEALVRKDGSKFGNCILYAPEAIGRDVVVKLPGKEQPRALVAIELSDCWVATVHLSRFEEFRLKSMPLLAEFAKGKTKPVIVMGDFNASPDSAAMTEFKKSFKVLSDEKIFTCPTVKPDETIDYIAVDRAHTDKVTVKESKVLTDEIDASDHYPLVMTLAFANDSSAALPDIGNIVARMTAERTARLAEGRAIAEYERHMKSLEEHRKMSGGGEQSETEDMERAVPRLKGLAEIEKKGRAESSSVREDAAFVDAFSPVLALDDDDARKFVAHLAKEKDDLATSDPELFARISSSAFQAERAQKLAQSGCGYTGSVFTYSSAKKLAKLRRQLDKRLTDVLVAVR